MPFEKIYILHSVDVATRVCSCASGPFFFFFSIQTTFSCFILPLLATMGFGWLLCNQHMQPILVTSVQFSGQDSLQMQMVVSVSFLCFSCFCYLRREGFDMFDFTFWGLLLVFCMMLNYVLGNVFCSLSFFFNPEYSFIQINQYSRSILSEIIDSF